MRIDIVSLHLAPLLDEKYSSSRTIFNSLSSDSRGEEYLNLFVWTEGKFMKESIRDWFFNVTHLYDPLSLMLFNYHQMHQKEKNVLYVDWLQSSNCYVYVALERNSIVDSFWAKMMREYSSSPVIRVYSYANFCAPMRIEQYTS